MQTEIYVLDLIGTFAFAVYGSYFALKKDFDLFGIFLAAFLTAVGGGTIRELILGNIPFYFFDSNYIWVIAFGMLLTIGIFRKFHRVQKFFLVADAVGLATFAFIGASAAANANLGFFAVVFCATLTAVGGGVLRDLVLREIPQIMYRDFYASVAILLGVVYFLAIPVMDNFLWSNVLITGAFFLRMVAIFWKINLWKPQKNNPSEGLVENV